MTIAGFKVRNHPQQVAKRGGLSHVDDRGTDPALFAQLHRRFGFTIDVAASARNAKLPCFYTIEEDGLRQPWAGERVWCNPPYSDIRTWVEKAWAEVLGPRSPALVVMLLPANRTEQRWWQELIEPTRDKGGVLRVEFIANRQRFVAHDADRIGPNERPPFGVCLAIWDMDR